MWPISSNPDKFHFDILLNLNGKNHKLFKDAQHVPDLLSFKFEISAIVLKSPDFSWFTTYLLNDDTYKQEKEPSHNALLTKGYFVQVVMWIVVIKHT